MAIKAIVVINPNNPTGSVLTLEHMWEVIKFAYKYGIVIIADEVYQNNIYGSHKFVSFKKAVCTVEDPYKQVSLVSFNSISKGYTGECGVRGGYMEFHNFDKDVLAQIHKIRDACSVNAAGSIAVAVLCDPPSYENCSKATADQFFKERDAILSGLAKKAQMTVEVLNQCTNIECPDIGGAMYAFPRVNLPQSVLDLAKKANQEASEYFCREMLEATGIITVPGSGFGQDPDTYHFRMSLLLWDLNEFEEMLAKMKKFINEFFAKHT